jgi:inner membrane protein
MVVAANAPDVDVVSWFGGSATYIQWHRNITHSLIAAPFVALLAVALVRAIGRREVRWLHAWGIALVAVASHLTLDLTNVYGVRLWLPFSGRWFHWDLTPIIDFAIWAILLLGVAAPALGRLVGSEIGESRRESGNAGWAITALFLLTTYDYSRSLFHDRAVAVVDSHIYNGLAPRRAGAFPSQNPMVWTGMAELSNAYFDVPVDLRGNFHVSDGETYYKGERTEAVNAAMATDPFQKLLAFVQYPLWSVEAAPDTEQATRVTLLDLRFGTPRQPGFAATATVNNRNQVIESAFRMGGTRPR